MQSHLLLKVRDLQTQFVTSHGTVHAVNEVSFDLARGERLAIVGETGSGKTAMALSLLKLLPRSGRIVGGSVLLDNQDLLQLDEQELMKVRGKAAAMVFQDPMTSLNPVMRVREQLVPPIRQHLGMDSSAALDRVVELLRKVGISDPESRVHSYPHELSGGMRQRVLIAMALSCGPKVIIADEPTTALDVTIQAQIVALLKGLSDDTGTAVLFITHDFGLVARFAHRVAVMYAGSIIETGAVNDLFANPLHPYTQGLLGAIPAIAGPKPDRLAQISGSPPDMKSFGSGCPFMPRCSLASAQCGVEQPLLLQATPGHAVACWAAPIEGPAKEMESVTAR